MKWKTYTGRLRLLIQNQNSRADIFLWRLWSTNSKWEQEGRWNSMVESLYQKWYHFWFV